MISAEFRKRRQMIASSSTALVLLKITHENFTAPFTLVNDRQNVTSKGVEYIAYPFYIKLPDDRSGEAPQAKLMMDNPGGDFQAELEALPPGKDMWAEIIIIDSETPDVHDYTLKMPVTVVTADTSLISASVGMDYMYGRSAILLRQTPEISPGIFG